MKQCLYYQSTGLASRNLMESESLMILNRPQYIINIMSRNPYLDLYRKSTSKITNLFREISNIECLTGQFSLIYSTMGCVLSDMQSIISCVFPPKEEIIEIHDTLQEIKPIPKHRGRDARWSQPVQASELDLINRQVNELNKKQQSEVVQSIQFPKSIGFSGMIDCQPSQIIRKKRDHSENSRKLTNINEYISKNQKSNVKSRPPVDQQNFFDILQKKKPLYKM